MKERKDSIGSAMLRDCEIGIRGANGELNPDLAWKMASMIEFSRQPNIPLKIRLRTEEYMDRLGISDDLASKLIEIRQDVVSNYTLGSNLKQAGVGRMSLFLMETY